MVEGNENITVHRGVAVNGLLTGDGSSDGVPHVIGVRTDAGEEFAADIVIDAGGRRSKLPSLLADIGARAPIQEEEDCGFVYYGRHFKSGDGSVPAMFGPLLMAYESLSILTLPADNGTWGVGWSSSAKDAAVRGLKDVDTWTRTVKGYPLAAHWLDGEPIDDGVAIMAKIEDRHRTFVIDGEPVATGVLPLADSWACTNPSVGRGISIGVIHAAALRDLLRDASPTIPSSSRSSWYDATMETVEPWYRGTLDFRSGSPRTDPRRDGRPRVRARARVRDDDGVAGRGGQGPRDAARRSSTSRGSSQRRTRCSRVRVCSSEVIELGSGWRDERLPGLSREELLAVVNA